MRDIKYHAYLDSQERSIILHSLVELKNQLIPMLADSGSMLLGIMKFSVTVALPIKNGQKKTRGLFLWLFCLT